MQAVLYEAFGQIPTICDLPDPSPSPTGVVIQVGATGVCRSDWHGWMGHDPDIRLPHVPGHELAGTIVAIGSQVKQWKVGERVTLPFVCGCGTCPQCLTGNHQVCDHQSQPGFTQWGSFAEYVAIEYADTNLVRIPEAISTVTAASLGCRFVTSFRAVADQGRVRGGDTVVVFGCGGVGLSAIMIASAFGAQVIAVDIFRDKLELARRVGADIVIDGSEVPDVPSAVRDLTKGGAQVSIDALGNPKTCYDAIASLAKRGRHVQIGLLLADQRAPSIPMDLVIARELEIVGSHGMQAHRYHDMLSMIEQGRLHPERLIGDLVDLQGGIEALVHMDRFQAKGITVVDRF